MCAALTACQLQLAQAAHTTHASSLQNPKASLQQDGTQRLRQVVVLGAYRYRANSLLPSTGDKLLTLAAAGKPPRSTAWVNVSSTSTKTKSSCDELFAIPLIREHVIP